MNVLLTDQPGADAWPITGASFILMRLNSRDANTASALAFFDWAYRHGQSIAQQLDYVPIPPAVVRLVESRWQHLRVDGKPVWPRSP